MGKGQVSSRYIFMGREKQQNSLTWWQVLGMVGQLGYMIALPAAGLGYLGAVLDRKFHTSPLFILAGLGLAIFISAVWVWRMVRKIEEK